MLKVGNNVCIYESLIIDRIQGEFVDREIGKTERTGGSVCWSHDLRRFGHGNAIGMETIDGSCEKHEPLPFKNAPVLTENCRLSVLTRSKRRRLYSRGTCPERGRISRQNRFWRHCDFDP